MNTEVTQDEWVDSVLLAWKMGKSIGFAVALAFKMDCEDRPKSSSWDAAIEKLRGIRPALSDYAFLKKPVSAWIADDFANASKALFDGRIEDAAKWLVSGKDEKRKVLPRKPRKRVNGQRLVISVRDRDKGTAWNVVK